MRVCAAFATVIAALALAILATPVRAESGCEGAEALRDARLLEQAQTEYEAVAGTSPAPACAKDVATVKALRKQAAAELDRAKRLEGANEDADARDVYAAAAERDASLSAASDGLKAIVAAGGGEPCADARALQRARLLEEAEARAREGACANPDPATIAGERTAAADRVEEAGTDETAGEFASARAEYVEAANADAGSKAAERLVGLVSLQANRACAAAEALAKANLLEPAAEAYERLLDDRSDPPCARAGLAAVEKNTEQAEKALEAGKKLESGGDLAGARAKFAEAAALDASSGEARRRLTRLADEGESLPEQARDLLEDLVPWLALALAVATLVALVFALALRMWPVRRWMARRVWKGYDGSRRIGRGKLRLAGWSLWRGVLALPRWATRVGLTVDAIDAGGDADRGGAIKKLIEAEMPKPSGGGRRTVDVVTGPLAAPSAFTDLGNAIKSLPQAKLWEALVNIISRALPRETLKLSGQLVGSKTPDTSLSLVLSRSDGSAVGSVTLRVADYFGDGEVPQGADGSDADARVRALALAGATWAAFAYLEYRAMLKPNEWRQYLGTRDWRSYALVQAGCRAGSEKAAYALFSRARDADPVNRTALFDLASAAFRMGRDNEAQSLVRAATVNAVALDPPGRGTLRIDLLTLRIRYLQGAMAVHANCDEADPGRISSARQTVTTGVEQMLDALDELETRNGGWGSEEQRLDAELRTLAGPLLVLWAVLVTLGGDDDTIESAWIGQLAHEPPGIVHWLTTGRAADVRTHYNLACYYALLEQPDLGSAFPHLEQCLHIPQLATWADEDPTLQPLRDGDPAKWAQVRGQIAEGLAQIDCIGEHARALKSNGIGDERTLFDNTKGSAQRLALAEVVGVTPLLVERWARLCETQWRLELDRTQLNVLDRASAGSIGVLRHVEAGQLHALLRRANEKHAADLPSEETVSEWIEEAKDRPEQVAPVLG